MREIRYRPGEAIIEEGTFGDTAYILKSGTVEVLKKTEHEMFRLATLEAEEIFGEMGLIEDKPRSASIVSGSEVIVDEITREDFLGLLEDKKSFIIPILRALFERLRQTNDLVIRLESQIGGKGGSPAENVTQVTFSGLTKEAAEAIKGQELVITKFPYKIGRNSTHISDAIFTNNDLGIDDHLPYNVSKNHMSINLHDNQFYILDRGSSLGTIVNGKQIGGNISNYKAALSPGENSVILGSSSSPYQFKIVI